MSAYHQMGHHSQNLISEKGLSLYKGAITSPVNYTEKEVVAQVNAFQSDEFEVIFDPQLYFPNSTRGKLCDWSYFPSDVDTADHSNIDWWSPLVTSLADCVKRVGAGAICSPAIVPRTYSEEYQELTLDVAMLLKRQLVGTGIDTLLTVMVPMNDLANHNRAAEIASIITTENIDRVYLVFTSDIDPRREFKEPQDLVGAMKLIRYLEAAGVRVLVACASSELVLWKFAGAKDCATGKFFNLRRYTHSRFEPPSGGGGQISYWLEEALMAFIREPDLLRIQSAGLLSEASKANPYCQKILETLPSGRAWLALSWKQYLYWFADIEDRLSRGETTSAAVLEHAEDTWVRLKAAGIIMEEPRNDGQWIRPWRRAISEV